MKQNRKEKGNVPNLRFPEFTGEWESSKIGEDCEIQMCKRIFAHQTQPIGDVPFYKIGTIGGDADTFISNELYEEYKAKYNYPRKGEVLISCAGTVGKCIVYDGHPSYYQDSNIVWVRNPENKYLNSYLRYIIANYNWGKLNSTTITRIYNDDLRNLIIKYSSIPEQKRICNLLILLDNRIATQIKIIEDLKKLKTALVDGLYASPSGSPRLRFQEFQKSWMQTNLGSITQNFNRRNKNKIVYPMFSVTNNSGFITQSEKFGDREMVGEDVGSYKIVNLGEFAYNPARINVGSIARYNGNESCMISSLYVCFRLKSGISFHWALHLLKSHRMNFYYNVYGEGGVRVYLFYPNFARIKVFVPELLEQEKIGAMLSAIDKRIDLERNLNDKYQQQKTFLLRQMFI
jgi:type I restriction enzyme S subunit